MHHIKFVVRNVLCWMGYHTLHMKLITIHHDKHGMYASCGWCGFTGEVNDHGKLM